MRTKIPIFFFLSYLLLGIFLLPDYGFSWDEGAERLHGLVFLDYVNEKFDHQLFEGRLKEEVSFKDYTDKYHGVLYSMTCVGITEVLFGIEDFRTIYLIRHTVVFSLFWLGCVFFYRLLLMRFQDYKKALFGVCLLLMTPRLFAQSFYNPKDIVLFSFMLIGTYTLLRFLKKPTVKWAMLHGLITALAINARIVGIILLAISLGFFAVEWWQSSFIHQKGKVSISILVYLFLSWLLTVTFHPFLWDQPVLGIVEMFEKMSKFQWNGHILLWGEYHLAQELPWFYLPSWLLITIPLAFILLHFIGFFQTLKRFFSNLKSFKFYQTENEKIDLLALGLYFLPIVVIILKKSVVYDGWRHIYFVYPSFLIIALAGFFRTQRYLQNRTNGKKLVWLLYLPLIINLAFVGHFMIKSHPNQQVYFNFIADHGDLTKRFTLDYWGLGYKTALEEILKKDDRTLITVRAMNYPGHANIWFLPPEKRKRIKLLWGSENADYTLSQFRGLGSLKKVRRKEYPFDQEFFTVKSGRNPICGVYKTNLKSEGGKEIYSREKSNVPKNKKVK